MELSLFLKIDDYDQDEVLLVLQNFFPHGTRTGPYEISMFITETDSVNNNYAIKCKYIKTRRKLSSIETGPAFPHEYAEQIKQKLESDLKQTNLIVRNQIFFSDIPVKESYLLNDAFQILPPPEQAPVSDTIFGLHPFILQFKITDSPNFIVKMSRYLVKSRELCLLLSVFLNTNIRRMNKKIKHHWVGVPQEHSSMPKALFCQEFYSFDGFQVEQEEFDTIVANQMPKIEINQYYNTPRDLGSSLMIPENFDILFEKYHSLDGKLKEKFIRSAYWYHHSTVEQNSKSAAYLNFINAIETLAANRKALSKCPTCEKETGAVEQFKSFISQFAPTSNKEMNELYNNRSDITHGRRIFEDDKDELMGFTPFRIEEWFDYDKVKYTTKIALINWLLLS